MPRALTRRWVGRSNGYRHPEEAVGIPARPRWWALVGTSIPDGRPTKTEYDRDHSGAGCNCRRNPGQTRSGCPLWRFATLWFHHHPEAWRCRNPQSHAASDQGSTCRSCRNLRRSALRLCDRGTSRGARPRICRYSLRSGVRISARSLGLGWQEGRNERSEAASEQIALSDHTVLCCAAQLWLSRRTKNWGINRSDQT
jgi:hypothetical protein